MFKNERISDLFKLKSLRFIYSGIFCSMVAEIIERFGGGSRIADFTDGVFSGLCMALIITGLILIKK